MPTHGRTWLAPVLATVTATLTIAGLMILLLTLDHPPQGGWGFRGFPTIFTLVAGVVGWLIMVRRPENRIGLMLAVIGALNAGQLFLTEYASTATRVGLPAANLAGWVNSFIWVPIVALLGGGLPLIFPDGRLPSRRWRPAVIVLTLSAAVLVVIIALYPSALDTPRTVDPPLRLPIDDATLNRASYVAIIGVAVGVLASAASLLRRWRQAHGVVREQLKWLSLSLVAVVATMWLAVAPSPVANAAFIAAIATVPVAIGIAVLRHGLYEIDTVISRTLVFGVLTAILTGGFAALLKLMQSIFVAVTGNESDAATVITTLILATAFVPLKHAVEGLVERRFKPAPEGPAVAGAPDDADRFEALLRRVVREEIQAAMHEPVAGRAPE